MWLKLVWMIMIASSVLGKPDELLDTLYGQKGRNKVAICVASASGRWRRCDGALFRRQWVIARATCIANTPSERLFVERLSAGGSCEEYAAGYTGVYRSRDVEDHILHPWFDLVLVITKTPYNNLDRLANTTKIRHRLHKHGVYTWMKYYFDAYALARNQRHHLEKIARNLKSYHSPLWIFFITMVMPTVLFMLIFVYIIFYTGTPAPEQEPYKRMSYSKRVRHV